MKKQLLLLLTAITLLSGNIMAQFAGGDGSSGNPWQITTPEQLNNVRNYLGSSHADKHFRLENDIDLSNYLAPGGAGYIQWGDAGWLPIGSGGTNYFGGSFDGNNHFISGLWIDNSTISEVGLFGRISGGSVINLKIQINGSVKGTDGVGTLAGYAVNATISGCHAKGDIVSDGVSNKFGAGGLVGFASGGTIGTSSFEGTVITKVNSAGGLVGKINNTTITECFASGGVQAEGSFGDVIAGGLVGFNESGSISNCYSLANTTRISTLVTSIGGFVGSNNQGSIANCYSTGWVYCDETPGYVTDKGFCGHIITGGSYSMTGNFWDTETSQASTTSGEATGRTTVQMKNQTTYTGWDFTNTWAIENTESYPYLQDNIQIPLPGAPLFAGGEGTVGDPFLITTSAHLNNIRYFLGTDHADKHFILENDIDLTDYLALGGWGYAQWGDEGWLPIGNSPANEQFLGKLNGNGYNITELTINRPTASNVGLFGYLGSEGEVKKLGVTINKFLVYGQSTVGGLVGQNDGTIESCFVSGPVKSTEYSCGGLVGINNGLIVSSHFDGSVEVFDNSAAGGLVGNNYKTIKQCYSTGSVKGTDLVGGLVGSNNYWGNISNCYSRANVIRSSGEGTRFGGFAGQNYQGVIINSYSTGWVKYGSVIQVDKGFVASTTTIGNFLMEGNFWDTETSGASSTGGAFATGKTTDEMTTLAHTPPNIYMAEGWDFKGSAADGIWNIGNGRNNGYPYFDWQYPNDPDFMHFPIGDGTEGNPFQITTPEHLNNVRNYLGASHADKHFLIMTDIDLTTYLTDGNPGYNVGAFWEPIGTSAARFMGKLDGGNFEISGFKINRPTEEFVGLFGFIGNGAEVKDLGVIIDGSVIGKSNVGALTGLMGQAIIDNCNVSGGSVVGESLLGGLVGEVMVNWGDNNSITNSHALVDVTGSSSSVGGLVGYSYYTTLHNCFATGHVTGTSGVGGLIGYANSMSSLTNCHATGNVTGTINTGGLVGYLNSSQAQDCSATGNVTGTESVGGLIGYTNNPQCRVIRSYALGNVEGEKFVGGFVGFHITGNPNTYIRDSYSKGAVTRKSGSTELSIGGFVGAIYDSELSNSYSTGAVTYVGATNPTDKGFVGTVTTGTNFSMSGNFWDTQTSGNTTTGGDPGEFATGKTTTQMKAYSTFTAAGWDFMDEDVNGTDYIWGINFEENNGYPFLAWQEYEHKPMFMGGDGTEDFPFEIRTAQELDNVRNFLGTTHADKHFIVMNDVSLSGSWTPIGNATNRFEGKFDGNNKKVTGLKADIVLRYVALFGYLGESAEVYNLGVVIDETSFVKGTDYVGGLAGFNSGLIESCYAIGEVQATATYSYLGVLVGANMGTIKESYSAGQANVLSESGGFVGYNGSTGIVSDCYTLANVKRTSGTSAIVGGFIGFNNRGKILRSYSAGKVTNASDEILTDKGFCGDVNTAGDYEMSGNFWDTETSGATSTAGGATGLTTAQMNHYGPFFGASWDFRGETTNGSNNIWNIGNGRNDGYPYFDWQFPADDNPCFNPYEGGEIAGDQTICYNTSPAAFSSSQAPSGYAGTLEYKWQRSTSSSTGGFTDISGSNAATYAPGSLTQTTWYKRLSRVGCKADWNDATESNVIQVTVLPDFTPGAIATTGETIEFAGTPSEIGSVTPASGGDDVITYRWQSSTNEGFTSPTVIESNTATYTPPSELKQTTWYRRQAKDDECNTAWETSEGVWKVTVGNPFNDGDGTSDDPFQITNATQFNNVRYFLGSTHSDKHFKLMNDVDLTLYLDGHPEWGTNGWLPIGDSWENSFRGTFDGSEYKITGLWIARASSSYVGLFGFIHSGDIFDVGVEIDGIVSGNEYVGGLAGGAYNGNITNSYVTDGEISGDDYYVGGLVGSLNSGNVTNSFTSGVKVSGVEEVGGLVGVLTDGEITDSYVAEGEAFGNSIVGGLIGLAENQSIARCYVKDVTVVGGSNVGGLIGVTTSDVLINSSYAIGEVNGDNIVGGFVGYFDGAEVESCYAMANVTRSEGTSEDVGGFIGLNYRGIIQNCYSTGSITDGVTPLTGKGFCGSVDTGTGYSMSGNFWDIQTSGATSSAGEATGLTTAEMKLKVAFKDWDFLQIWNIVDSDGQVSYPFLLPNPQAPAPGLTSAFAVTHSKSPACTLSVKTGNTAVASGTLVAAGAEIVFTASTEAQNMLEWEVNGEILTTNPFEYTIGNLAANTVVNVTAKPIVVAWPTASSITYGQELSESALGSGETNLTGTFAFTNPTEILGAGTHTDVSVTFTPVDDTYSPVSSNITVVVDTRVLTIGGSFTAHSKTYDRTTTASMDENNLELANIFNSDDVHLDGVTIAFASNVVNNDISVSITNAGLSGDDKDNYTLSLTGAPTTTADIEAKELTVINAAVTPKVYNGTTTATIANAELSGVISPDEVIIGNATTGTFAQATVGEDIAVTTAMTISGTHQGNYYLTQPELTGNITHRSLEITPNSFIKTEGIVYTFQGSEFTTYNLVAGDTVTYVELSSDGAAVEAELGEYDIVITPGSEVGVGLDNYTATYNIGRLTVVDQTEVILTGLTVHSRPYDGTVNAIVDTWGTLVGVTEGHDVTLDFSEAIATFNNKNVGVEKNVYVSGLALSGEDADKYYINNHIATADITTRALTLDDFIASSRIYDGTTNATGTGFSSDMVEGDDLIFSYSASFADKHVGEGKPVNFTGIEIASGEDKDNYHLATTNGTAYADITEKPLNVVNATAQAKTYDGTDAAEILGAALSTDDLIVGDAVTLLNHTVGTFAQAGVGESIAVTTSMSIAGDDAQNYAVVQPVGLTANIEHRPLTITANSFFKPYGELFEFDGTEFTTDNLVAGDEVTEVALISDGAAADATPGDYDIVITPDSEVGNGLENYDISYAEGTLSVRKEISVDGLIADDKVYDGTTEAIISFWGSLEGVNEGDDVTLDHSSASATFDTKNVGTDKDVTIVGLQLAGNESEFYMLSSTVIVVNADIIAKELTVAEAIADDKIYDGGVSATISGAVLVGVITDEDVELDALVGTFAQATVGDDIPVTAALTITGDDADNYTLTQPTGLTASISALELTIGGTFTVLNKVYDGTVAATIDENDLILLTPIAGDDVELINVVAEFEDADVGEDKTVTIISASIDGAEMNNYTLSLEGAPTTTASITELITYYTLTINIVGEGSVEVDGEPFTVPVVVDEGTVLDLEAIAAEGWLFDGWTGGVADPEDATTTITMDADKAITATFTEDTPPVEQFTLTVTIVGSGSVEVDGEAYTVPIIVDEGTVLDLEAIAAEGWLFDGWTGGVADPEEATTTITMDADKAITATFTEDTPPVEQFTLTVTIVGSGSVEVNGEAYTVPIIVDEGTVLDLEAIAADGWLFDGWTGGVAEALEATTTITMDTDKAITATFTEDTPPVEQFTLTVTIVGNGSVEVDGEPYTVPVVVDEGTVLDLEAIADAGWQFDGWTGAVTEVLEVTTITMDADKSITATFSIIDNVETGILANLRVYPNPFRNSITVDNAEGVSRIIITNLIGQRVMDIQLSGAERETIQTDGLVRGVYLITFQSENGERVVRKMVKE